MGFLRLLSDHAAEIRVFDRRDLEGFLGSTRFEGEPADLSDAALTRAFVAEVKSHLDPESTEDVNDPPGVLTRIRTRRDKQVAHNEDWIPAVNDIVSWSDLRLVLDEAKRIAGLVGPAYLQTHFAANDGTYRLTKQSAMVGVQAERLLKAVAEWMERAGRA